MEVYNFTKEQLEDYLDSCKTNVLITLVTEKILDFEKANEWCNNHTVLIRSKSFFRTITDKWRKEPTKDQMIIVKKVE